jgi:hypothetical protein
MMRRSKYYATRVTGSLYFLAGIPVGNGPHSVIEISGPEYITPPTHLIDKSGLALWIGRLIRDAFTLTIDGYTFPVSSTADSVPLMASPQSHAD